MNTQPITAGSGEDSGQGKSSEVVSLATPSSTEDGFVAETGIPFTQYLRPHGRKAKVSVERPAEVAALAQQFIAMGGWFECEELSTGHASLTACMLVDDEPDDIEIQIVPNGPEVPAAVDRLVRAAVLKATEIAP